MVSLFSFSVLVIGFILLTQPVIEKTQINSNSVQSVDSEVVKIDKKFNGLGFTSSEFLNRFKGVAKEASLKVNIKKLKVSDNGEKKIMNVEASKNLALLITVDKTSDMVIDIILIGVGDGTIQSGANIIIGFIAAIAATNPELSKAERGDVLGSLGIFSDSNEANGETIRQGIKYNLARTEQAGTWLTISSEKAAS